MDKIDEQARQCEKSQCTNLVKLNQGWILTVDASRALRQRYCLDCANNIQQELTRKKWRDDLGMG